MNYRYFDWDSQWNRIAPLIDEPSMNKYKRVLAEIAYAFLNDPVFFRFDEDLRDRLLNMDHDEAVNYILEIGLYPFSPVEIDEQFPNTIEDYEHFMSFFGEGDTLFERWMNSSYRNKVTRWALHMQCQILSGFIFQLVYLMREKGLIPDDTIEVVAGPTHTFVVSGNVVYDILFQYWNLPIEEIETEIKKGKRYLDPIEYLEEDYGCLDDELLDILHERI